MNTPAHLILAAAAFARPNQRGTLTAALCGAIAPDLSLYLLVGWHIGVLGTPAEIVFSDLYYSSHWQSIFAIDNSVFVWGLILALALHRRWLWVKVFSASALLHLAFDLPLHAGDGRPHFWPVSDWVFNSPVSYWDSQFFGWLIGPFGLVAAAAITVALIRRYRSIASRLLFASLVMLEVAASGVWMWVF